MNGALVVWVGMTPFVKPSVSPSYLKLGAAAARAVLQDSGIDYCDLQQAYVGYVYGDSTSGQAALYDIGLSGILIVNVNNNSATGSTALYLERQAIASGAVDCVLAFGFEQMVPGALQEHYADRPDARIGLQHNLGLGGACVVTLYETCRTGA